VILVSLHLRAAPSRSGEFVQALRLIMRAARAEKGFITCQISLAADDENTVVYEERWRTQGDFEEQARSARYTRLLSLVESASEQPSLEFHFVSETRGLEYLAAVRATDGTHQA
jgi:quinol monooxygenase YgiN